MSQRQFFFLIIQTQIGVGILSLPYDLHIAAKQDGWLSLIIGAFIIQFVLIVLWLLGKKYPEWDLFQMIEFLTGKWLGKVLSLSYAVYFTFVGALVLVLFGRMISGWILPNTPIWVITFLMTSVSLYLVCSGIKVVARFFTMLSALLLFLLFLLVFSLNELKLMYLFPVATSSWKELAAGVNSGMLAFLGFILILVIAPKVKGAAVDTLKTIFIAHWFVAIFYLIIVLISFTFFSTEELPLVSSPILYMLKSFEFTVVSRVDLFFLSVWIVSVTTTFTIYIYMSGVGLMRVFHSQNKKVFLIVTAAAAFFISFWPIGSQKTIDAFTSHIMTASYGMAIFLPFILYGLSLFRKKNAAGSER
nr:GerAB/ArcD/ProY family transporter [Thalassobacillus sp. CUG 92003]